LTHLETILWRFIILTLILTYYRQSRINVERKILINPKNIDKYILRFIISGSIIALAVLTSKFFGSTIGSVMAAFPASFLSGLFISIRTNYLSQSQRLALGMSTSGLLNTIPFAIILYILLLHYHALLALSTAFAVSIIMSVISYKYIMRTNPT